MAILLLLRFLYGGGRKKDQPLRVLLTLGHSLPKRCAAQRAQANIPNF
jgi:hypothetical protein